MQTYRTTAADTLEKIAMRFDLGYVELLSANPGVDPWMPGIGVEITLPTARIPPRAPHKGIVINISEMRLYYFGADGALVHSRSEEHTSELQSLMRISYAVFCL